MEATSFGVQVLDKLLGGSLVRGKTYLLEADSGTQPRSITYPFVKNALDTGELVIFASNEEPAEDVAVRLQDYGIAVDAAIKAKQLLLLDLWSENEEEAQGIIRAGNPADPHKVLFVYSQAYEYAVKNLTRMKSRLILESLSGSVTQFGFERAHRMASRVVRMMKQGGVVGLSVLVPKMHAPTVSESFKYLYDGVIQLTVQDENDRLQKYIRVVKSPLPGFITRRIPYEVTNNGFMIPSEKGISTLLNGF
ncbi:MAG: RAD55 family ATPase [Promethearchaeota archaeon]